MALYERERSGQGQAIEVPMFETLVSFLATEQLAGQTFVPPLGPAGYPRVMSAHRKPYRTSDGHLALLPYTSAQWLRFFDLSGHAGLARDPRYATPAARSANIDALYATLAEIVAQRTTAEWLALLRDADIPHSELPHFDTLVDDPHLRATGTGIDPFQWPGDAYPEKSGLNTPSVAVSGFSAIASPSEPRSVSTSTCSNRGWSSRPFAFARPASWSIWVRWRSSLRSRFGSWL